MSQLVKKSSTTYSVVNLLNKNIICKLWIKYKQLKEYHQRVKQQSQFITKLSKQDMIYTNANIAPFTGTNRCYSSIEIQQFIKTIRCYFDLQDVTKPADLVKFCKMFITKKGQFWFDEYRKQRGIPKTLLQLETALIERFVSVNDPFIAINRILTLSTCMIQYNNLTNYIKQFNQLVKLINIDINIGYYLFVRNLPISIRCRIVRHFVIVTNCDYESLYAQTRLIWKNIEKEKFTNKWCDMNGNRKNIDGQEKKRRNTKKAVRTDANFLGW